MNASELAQVVQATVRVLRDSTRIDDIIFVADMLGRKRYGTIVTEFGHRQDMIRLLRERPEINHDTVDFEALRALPPDTFGGAYARHLHAHDLDVATLKSSSFLTEPTEAYISRRLRQSHDVWHALLGLGVEGHEEVLVHAFTLGQLRLPVSVAVVALGGIKHIVLERRWQTLRHELLEAYRLGQDCGFLLAAVWEEQWGDSMEEVRQRYGIRPIGATLH